MKSNRSKSKHSTEHAIERSLADARSSTLIETANSSAPMEERFLPLLRFRSYQLPVFMDETSGVLVLHWARQIGKSYTLAAWAVSRLLSRPGRLVTVLSNSRENGAEFLAKCAEICRQSNAVFECDPANPPLKTSDARMELRLATADKVGRIKVLAANPRTARGFSGDLILDEFAFHENSAAIWEAAEPILSSNPDFLCRIASTGNGKHNLFHHFASPAAVSDFATPAAPEAPGMTYSRAGFRLSRVTRTLAYQLGCAIYDPVTRAEIDPVTARAKALDKAAYDQNYECVFADEHLTLLSSELIAAAEGEGIGAIAEQDWPSAILDSLRTCNGRLFAGFDVARHGDLSVITVAEKLGEILYVRTILRMRRMRLPEQQERLGQICRLPQFTRAAVDMTGLGWGLVEYAQKEFGLAKIEGINFASTVPLTTAMEREGRRGDSIRVTESLAMELLRAYEERRIRHPADNQLREDLRKPERITTPGGRVSIAATRDEAGHADHFWSLALAVEAAASGDAAGFGFQKVSPVRAHREMI